LGEAATISGPDLENDGYAAAELQVGDMVLGHVAETPVVLARTRAGAFAVGARCTHYGASLGAGRLHENLVFCPLHHSAFDLRTGAPVRAPALNPVPRFAVTERDGTLFVGSEEMAGDAPPAAPAGAPDSVVVLGAGAAAATAVETLRNEGYRGAITVVGAEPDVPTDRPNLSKDYLAGNAPEDWMPLRSEGFYSDNDVTLKLSTRATSIDRAARSIKLEGGGSLSYGALLIATGADPVRLPLPGADQDHVFTLRTLGDSRAIISAIEGASSAVVMGASFIGLEAAASLRERGLTVHVVAPELVVMEPILGTEVGEFIRGLHESHGVIFHLGHVASEIGADLVVLDDGSRVPADLVVMGVGVRPAFQLAADAGLETDRGVVVDEHLRTADPNIWAAGDVAVYPDRRRGKPTRVEHWVLAQRHGQVAALNMLGRAVPFRDAPFFWSQHYDVRINYVGHAEGWDELAVRGSISDGDALIAYKEDGRIAAVATIGRDLDNLDAHIALEEGDEAALGRLA
jgi:NADPH-dependent 2,4-dienoyl-CoA reductase/sulfur reductase-like enzyme/nitrite reductase/ring-hydroxylating ferredoxin subunit